MIWTAIGSIATAVAAGFTAWMVYLTRRGIEQNVEQHKDGYRPTLVFLPHHGTSAEARTRVLQHIATPPTLRVWGTVRNIGVGPAINARMAFRIRGIEGFGPDPLSLPPIGAGDLFGKIGEPILLQISYGRGFNETDAQSAPGEHWELLLEYEDVFGRVFHTVHPKNPQAPWTTIGRGPAPKGRDPKDVERELQATSAASSGAPISLSAP